MKGVDKLHDNRAVFCECYSPSLIFFVADMTFSAVGAYDSEKVMIIASQINSCLLGERSEPHTGLFNPDFA